ncbi:type II CRISPR-associated endonuclease Cas1 [uncultured Desulfovibrio sp.]|uniref:type II CRISPR-associated endonuclease Cas1 n=1 Tax=uncultured Desulfovibrio sp. TaxID=167968 RepID=UPI0026111C32|nr:type II CRISPR-associated endonuclease Cas1 [uncultured Desulfovibrio sp.]
MSWRGLCVSSPARLDLRAGRLLLCRDGEEDVALPLEDLAFVVIDTPQARLSAALLSACAEQGCLLLTVDARHLPCAALLPLAPYYRQLSTVRAQVALGEARKKRLWQACVRAKIDNQAACLRLLGRHGDRQVACLRAKVGSGDPDNVEAVAARLYWARLFRHFRRDPDAQDRRNSLLNYAYALLRACTARELAARGFVPALGIHHRGQYNAFNLADDLMEAWRPAADLLVARHLDSMPEAGEGGLGPEDKRALLGLLHSQVDWQGGLYPLPQALGRHVEAVRAYYADKGPLPAFPGLAG